MPVATHPLAIVLAAAIRFSDGNDFRISLLEGGVGKT